MIFKVLNPLSTDFLMLSIIKEQNKITTSLQNQDIRPRAFVSVLANESSIMSVECER